MIDIHCHIIPDIDDGSKSMEKSVQQLKEMQAGGITHVFLTSHYFRGHYHYSREEYNRKFSALVENAREQGVKMELIPGFEVFLQHGIEEDVLQHNLTLGDSSYVLVETELNGLPTDFYDNLYKLLRKGFKPILAHAERYVSLMNKPSRVEELIEKNLYIQINAGSLLGQYGRNVMNTAWKMIDKGWAHFVGSDDHVRGKYTTFFQAKDTITEAFDTFTANLLFVNNSTAVLNNKSIEYKYLLKTLKPRHRKHRRSFFSRIFGK